VSPALLDDHLLRDLLADDVGHDLARVLDKHQPATTNLYLLRLCKSVVSARGGALTGSLPKELRQALGRQLVVLTPDIVVVPMQTIAHRMAEVAAAHRVSTLGAEAVVAAEHLGASLFVWEGDDGPGIRRAVAAVGGGYQTVAH
jgi:hypothetical protein